MSYNGKDVLFFFGAGASAPFEIPTMKQFVSDFEEYLRENANKSDRELYTDIKQTLNSKTRKDIDLEAVFSVINGIINYSHPEQLGMLSLYFTELREGFPHKVDMESCKRLQREFQKFVKEKCVIPDESFPKIKAVYKDFFNRLALESADAQYESKEDYTWFGNWTMFTTNYDTCLEYYWRDVVRVPVDTGFTNDPARKMEVLSPDKFLKSKLGVPQLFKIHGSISWLIEEESGKIIEVAEKGNSMMGRRYKGEMMLYPIAEKELYLDPYISMLWRLNRELEKKKIWIVVGYSFNDPVIREIFLKNFANTTQMILVHPHADEVINQRLPEFRGRIKYHRRRFGLLEDIPYGGKQQIKEPMYKKVNHQIIHLLKAGSLRINWHDNVVPS